MADPAPSEDKPVPSDKAPTDAERSPAPAKTGGAAFANTRQHVAGQQADGGTVERFTNTKINIALINDPKNGPRFTLTKREAGLAEKDDADKASDTPETPAEKAEKEASPTAFETPTPAKIEDAAPPSTELHTADEENKASEPTPGQPIDAAATSEPGGGATMPAAFLARAIPTGVPPAAQPPDKVPVDSSKTFVGHNGTYYDESWRWMDWRGTRQSWNWSAALSLGHWFAFRRLYGFAFLSFVLLAGLAAATVNDVPILAIAVLILMAVSLAGVYGNTLYFRAFRRAVDHVTKTGEGTYEELRSQLARSGGTSMTALSIMAVLSLTGIAGALAATYYLRGGFIFNFWPL